MGSGGDSTVKHGSAFTLDGEPGGHDGLDEDSSSKRGVPIST